MANTTVNPLEIKNLSVSFYTPAGEIEAVRQVSLTLHPHEILVLVGESGCGKSVLCKAVLKLLPSFARFKTGSIFLDGQNITDFGEKKMQPLRGTKAAMVFQNPLTTLDPVMTIGRQIAEACSQNENLSFQERRAQALQLLAQVGFSDGEERLQMLPYMLSGGQRQRCALAIALAAHPKVLLADEPTTALDATVQREILQLLKKLRRETDLSLIFVTHDLGAAAHLADRIGIMYAGRLVEIGTTKEIFTDPRHPYTWGLLASRPTPGQIGKRLAAIPGMPPDMLHPPLGDAFAPRNKYALALDYKQAPPFFKVSPTHLAATWLLDPRAPKITPP